MTQSYNFNYIFDGPSLIPLPQQQEQRGWARLQAPQNPTVVSQGRSIWVGNLDPRATAQQVRFAFSAFGDIIEVGNPTVDRSTFQRAWTIIDFVEAEAAQKAVRIYSNEVTSCIAHSMRHIQDLIAGEWPRVKLQVRPRNCRERSAAANGRMHMGQQIPAPLSLAANANPSRLPVRAT
ncbi:g2183 [Coccomyxa elongata]